MASTIGAAETRAASIAAYNVLSAAVRSRIANGTFSDLEVAEAAAAADCVLALCEGNHNGLGIVLDACLHPREGALVERHNIDPTPVPTPNDKRFGVTADGTLVTL